MKYTRCLNRLKQSLNKSQRLFVAICIPVVIFILAYGLISSSLPSYKHPLADFNDTWEKWLFYILVIIVIELLWLNEPQVDNTISTTKPKQQITNRENVNYGTINSSSNVNSKDTAYGAIMAFSFGWPSLIISWFMIYNGGEWGSNNIVSLFSSGNIAGAIGAFFGHNILAIVGLVSGVILYRAGKGQLLIDLAIATIIAITVIV